jgi:methyl-accepting chemotaxis protein
MERTRNGLFPLVIPALVAPALAGLALLFLAAGWFDADARTALKQRVADSAAAASRQFDLSVQRQADATRALGTSPMVWLWVKFQGERLTASNRSHAQWALGEVGNYSALLPGVTVYLASERTGTVYQGGAAVAALSRTGPRDAWYSASLGTEGVVVSGDAHTLRTSMRVMNGRELLGAISCVGDPATIADAAFAAAGGAPVMAFLLADSKGSVIAARGERAAAAATVFDMFNPAERANVAAAMAALTRPGATSVDIFAAKDRRLLTAVTQTTGPGWYLFVFSGLPGISAVRIILMAGIVAAALALLAGVLVSAALARARRNHALVQLLEEERDAAVLTAREAVEASLRLHAAAGTLRERTSALEAEAAGGKAAGTEAAQLLARAEESAAELRSGAAARVSLLEGLAASAREAAGSSHEARKAGESAGVAVAAAEEELNRVITTGSSTAGSLESAAAMAEAVSEAVERTRLLALNAALEATRSGGQGARIADEMRKLADEAAARAQELSAALSDARGSVRMVSRAAVDAGKAVHESAAHAADATRGLDAAWQGLDGVVTRLEAANVSAGRLRSEAVLSDRGRSAVEGASRIMARVEALCAEIATLAASMAAEAVQNVPRASGPEPQAPRGKAFS